MTSHLPPLRVRIGVAVIVLGTLGYYGIRSLSADANGPLTASGTIEAVVVNVSPEMAGKVSEVYARAGDSVKAGDPLLRLDDTLQVKQNLSDDWVHP